MSTGGSSITVQGLSKRYFIGHQRAKGEGLRHKLEQMVRNPLSWFRGTANGFRKKKEEFWALKDVNFKVAQGEVVGIIGRNGAGKSTLLKILSRITEPTEGRIRLRGQVASLLEIGTGFHQELTGRENIFLNGAILGMSRAEILSRFDEIVAFSEIEEFLDTPVKRYSSGMYIRLAFAVAAHLEPEILVVDEVLAVGDLAFQKKCLGKMGQVARGGRTVIFVSHNLEAVGSLCQRGIFLEEGRIQIDADVDSALDAYRKRCLGGYSVEQEKCLGLIINRVVLKNSDGREVQRFSPGEDLTVDVTYKAPRRIEKPYFVIAIQSGRGTCFTANMQLDGHRPRALEGEGRIACKFRSIPLLPQHYTVRMAIKASDGKEVIMDYEDVAGFSVTADLEEYGYKGYLRNRAAEGTPVVIPYEWWLPGGLVAPVSLEREYVQAV